MNPVVTFLAVLGAISGFAALVGVFGAALANFVDGNHRRAIGFLAVEVLACALIVTVVIHS